MNSNEFSAVIVRGAYKHYNSFHVLKGLDLTVPEHKIYGLLGPSGCGKTTLLSCIVGRLALNEGYIKLKARCIGEIGYMPQQLALHEELSILETFIYYGYIFHMSRNQIYKTVETLKETLQLPPLDNILGNVSGGQQRRVSMAVTMLHNPKLLILDEPTVGLDPIISQSIWDLMVKMTKSKTKTIIITTHYIEEARQADMVGLMRKGCLMIEAPPLQLLSLTDSDNLEEAFLKLCQQSVDEKKGLKDIPKSKAMEHISLSLPAQPHGIPQQPLILQNTSLFTITHFKAQLFKNIQLLRRNIPFTLFLVCLPILQCVTFNVACGHDPRYLSLGIVNEEVPNCSTHIYPIEFCILDENNAANVLASCRLQEALHSRTFKVIEYADMENGKSAVLSNKIWALLHFSQNFTISLASRINNGKDTDNGTFATASVDTWIDQSNKIIGDMLKRDILNSFSDVMKEILMACNMSITFADIPVKMEDPIYGSKESSFAHYASPAIVALCTFYLPAIYTGAVILGEKEGGVMERVVLSGMKFLEIALAHVTVQFIFLALQTTGVMVVMYGIFDNPLIANIVWTAVLITLIGICGMTFGFCVALMCGTMTGAAYIGIGSNFLLKFLCGMIWPTEGIHYTIKTVSLYLPLTLPTESLRSLTGKGLPIMDPSVYIGFASIIIWSIIFSILSFILLKVKRDVWTKR